VVLAAYAVLKCCFVVSVCVCMFVCVCVCVRVCLVCWLEVNKFVGTNSKQQKADHLAYDYVVIVMR
jgi:hypothetical protein